MLCSLASADWRGFLAAGGGAAAGARRLGGCRVSGRACGEGRGTMFSGGKLWVALKS
jgi:hypothetical protein